jgi:hypothetical protein
MRERLAEFLHNENDEREMESVRLANARLVTISLDKGEETVQITCGSLIREWARLQRFKEFKKHESPHDPPLSIRLSPDDVETLAWGYDFSRESVQEAGPYHYAIIFRKKWITTAKSH